MRLIPIKSLYTSASFTINLIHMICNFIEAKLVKRAFYWNPISHRYFSPQVSGLKFETQLRTLNQFPDTLLGKFKLNRNLTKKLIEPHLKAIRIAGRNTLTPRVMNISLIATENVSTQFCTIIKVVSRVLSSVEANIC